GQRRGGQKERLPGQVAQPGSNRAPRRSQRCTMRRLREGDIMLKRVAPVLWVLASMAGWILGTTAVSAAGAPKAYVGLFKDDAVAVIDTAQNKVTGTISVPKGPHVLVVTPDGRGWWSGRTAASSTSVAPAPPPSA